MSSGIQIEVLKEGVVAHQLTIGQRPVSIGRGPGNDIVIPEDTVSWHHALVWQENGRAWVRDIGARNGTFVNGDRVTGAHCLDDGDTVTLGPDVSMRVRAPDDPRTLGPRFWVLEDIESGLQFPLHRDRFHIGSGADADLHIEDGPQRMATLLVHANGEIWLGIDADDDGDDRPLEENQRFEVGGKPLRVLKSRATRAPTMEAEPARYPYALHATLNGATGPEATLTDLRSDLRHKVEAGNRAILLFLLGRKALTDLSSDRPPDERGWCSDHDVAVGIWGATQAAMDGNSLHVLVYRLRRELKKAGFDPWFIEKRRRFIRARLGQVDID